MPTWMMISSHNDPQLGWFYHHQGVCHPWTGHGLLTECLSQPWDGVPVSF